jgi:hypothetical protein
MYTQKFYFDGCSYTFGQSLELYCNPIETFTHDRMSKYKFTGKDFSFIRNNRWSNLVSIAMDCMEHNYSSNGNANGKILYDIKNNLSRESVYGFDYGIIQLTHFERFFSSKNFLWFPHEVSMENHRNQGVITLEEQLYTISNIEKIQLNYYLELIKLIEPRPDRFKILFWSNEWKDILSTEEMSKFGISIDGEYIIEDWAYKNKLHVNQDEKFLNNNLVKTDTHLSLEGHKILANKIIEQLQLPKLKTLI